MKSMKNIKFLIKRNFLNDNNCNISGCKEYKFGMMNVCNKHFTIIKNEFNKSIKKDETLSMIMIKNMCNTIIEKKLNIKIYKLLYILINFQRHVKESFSLKCQSSDKIKNFIKKYRKREFECSICADIINENEEIAKLPCGHNYHRKCLNRWIKINPCCPYCRSKNVFYLQENITLQLKYSISYREILSAFQKFWVSKNVGFEYNFILSDFNNLCQNNEISKKINCNNVFIIENIINNISKYQDDNFFKQSPNYLMWKLNFKNIIRTIPSKKIELSSDLRKNIISMINYIKKDKSLEEKGKNKIDYITQQLIYTQINRNHNQEDLSKCLTIFFNNNDKIKNIFKENNILKEVEKIKKITIGPHYVQIIMELYYLIICNELRFIHFLNVFNDYITLNIHDSDFKYDTVLFNRLKRTKLIVNKKDDKYYLYESELAKRIHKVLNNNCIKKINLNDYQKLILSLNYKAHEYNNEKLKEIEKFYNIINANNINLSEIYLDLNNIVILNECPKELTKIKINLVDIIDKKNIVFPIKTCD